MPPKKGRGRDKGAVSGKEAKGVVQCLVITPGPQYQLKTLVGYNDHCISKYRNPAYTFGDRRAVVRAVETPGPKYMIKEDRPQGFTFGLAGKKRYDTIGPGPKYMLLDVPRGPFFSMKWKTKLRKTSETPGPCYYIKPIADAPAFSMGLRTVARMPVNGTHFYSYSINVVKPRAPMYTMVGRRALHHISESPGPKYTPPSYKRIPAFSFGIKHHKCAPPLITECDKQY